MIGVTLHLNQHKFYSGANGDARMTCWPCGRRDMGKALGLVAGKSVAELVAYGEEIYDELMEQRIWSGTRALAQMAAPRTANMIKTASNDSSN